MSCTQIERLENLLIQSVAEPMTLEDFLSSFAQQFEASHGLITLRRRDDHSVEELLQEGFDEKLFEQYQEYYFSHCIWSDRLAAKPPQKFHCTDELTTRSELERSVFYNEFARPAGIRHGIAATLSVPGTGRYLQIGLLRGPGQHEFNADERHRMTRLIVPLQHFLQLRHAFSRRLQSGSSLEQLIDQYDTAALLLDRNRNLIHLNAHAEALLDSGQLFGKTGGKFELLDRLSARRMQGQIDRLFAEKRTTSLPAFAARVNEDEYQLRLFRFPYRHSGVLCERRQDCIALLIRKSGSAPDIDAESLQTLFGLTKTEASISIRLAQGMSPAEIARLRQVSISTLRTQIKSIHGKLGVSHQAELVRRILSSLASCTGQG